MNISINKIMASPELMTMAAKHLAYSMQDIHSYYELTPKEREIISLDNFKEIEIPVVEVYCSLKEKNPNHLVLCRCGEYYKTFNEDAKTCSNVLGITLLDSGETVFPRHALDTFLPKLIRAGHKVAVHDNCCRL